MILILDNFDSFTYNLVDYFHQLDLEVEVIRNNVALDDIKSKKYSAVVLSPGPGSPANAGNLMQILDFYYTKVPVFGICLGHQAIGKFFGGNIKKAEYPKHGKISKIFHEKDVLFDNIPGIFNVVRYHSLICSDLCDDVEIIAKTHKGEIMAIKHKDLPIYGLQFHPEAILTQYGLEILRNWKNINSLTN